MIEGVVFSDPYLIACLRDSTNIRAASSHRSETTVSVQNAILTYPVRFLPGTATYVLTAQPSVAPQINLILTSYYYYNTSNYTVLVKKKCTSKLGIPLHACPEMISAHRSGSACLIPHVQRLLMSVLCLPKEHCYAENSVWILLAKSVGVLGPCSTQK